MTTIYKPISNKESRQLQADPDFVPNLTGMFYRSTAEAVAGLERAGAPATTTILEITFKVVGSKPTKMESKASGLVEALLNGSDEPPNSAANLPAVDTSSTQSWANSFAAKVIAYNNLRKEHGKVLLPNATGDGRPHPSAGQEYDLGNFEADSYSGDLPWDEKRGHEVAGLLLRIPEYVKACEELGIEADPEGGM